jgi:general stress protein 26
MTEGSRGDLDKIKALIGSARICMVTNNIFDWPLTHQSLKNQWLDSQGNIWFIFLKKNVDHILYSNGRMEVFYANAEKSEFLSLNGTARVLTWNDLPEDHQFVEDNLNAAQEAGVVKFHPDEAYSWDQSTNNMVSLNISRVTYANR